VSCNTQPVLSENKTALAEPAIPPIPTTLPTALRGNMSDAVVKSQSSISRGAVDLGHLCGEPLPSSFATATPSNCHAPDPTSSTFPSGNFTVAVAFAGISTRNFILPSAISHAEATLPYMLSTADFAYFNPPPGRG